MAWFSSSLVSAKTRLIFVGHSCYSDRVSALGEPSIAWEPLTPRGVAAFARASFERLFVVQSVFALLAALSVLWLLSDGIFPTIEATIANLPESGSIHGGRLDWREDSPVILAEGGILAISVDLDHDGTLRSPADFQLEFGRDSVCLYSLFGEGELFYPRDYTFAVNQHDARPAWGAWSPNFLALTAIGIFFGMLITWFALATIYCPIIWLVCFFANRDLKLPACWRLAGAALMPGAALMSLSLVLYDLRAFDFVQLCFAFGMHLVIGWLYLFVSPLFLNRVLPADKKNPFDGKK